MEHDGVVEHELRGLTAQGRFKVRMLGGLSPGAHVLALGQLRFWKLDKRVALRADWELGERENQKLTPDAGHAGFVCSNEIVLRTSAFRRSTVKFAPPATEGRSLPTHTSKVPRRRSWARKRYLSAASWVHGAHAKRGKKKQGGTESDRVVEISSPRLSEQTRKERETDREGWQSAQGLQRWMFTRCPLNTHAA
jgi:hypothetical protein